MLFLLLAILLNAYLSVSFKVFPRWKIDTLQAIVFNYCTCVVTGSVFLGYFPIGAESVQQGWFPWALLMGSLFVSIFNLMGYVTIKESVAISTIANKLSLVIPVLFAVWLYGEPLNALKIAGILLAVPAVWLSVRSQRGLPARAGYFWPLLLFFGSGFLDTLVNFVTQKYFAAGATELQSGQAAYLVHSFAAAATIGLLLLTVLWGTGKKQFAWRHVLAGIIIGIPNYFSIYYLIRLLNSGFMDTSAAIPVVNIGIVLTASVAAIIFFGESTSKQRLAGIALSIIAILMIAFSGLSR